jgi:DNA end-binding protein Ku
MQDEVRSSAEYFDDVQDVKITKDMLELAKHIVVQNSGHFDPSKFEDHYEAALQDLLNKKQSGEPITRVETRSTGNVVDLMDALRASLKGGADRNTPSQKSSKNVPKVKPTAKRKGG